MWLERNTTKTVWTLLVCLHFFRWIIIFKLCALVSSFRNNLIMTHTLTGFMELMDHGIVSWENLSSIFIKKVVQLLLFLFFLRFIFIDVKYFLLLFVLLSDRQLRQRHGDRWINSAGVPGHPGEHGTEQPQPVRTGQTGSHHGETYCSLTGVSTKTWEYLGPVIKSLFKNKLYFLRNNVFFFFTFNYFPDIIKINCPSRFNVLKGILFKQAPFSLINAEENKNGRWYFQSVSNLVNGKLFWTWHLFLDRLLSDKN